VSHVRFYLLRFNSSGNFCDEFADQLEGRASTSGTLFRWDGQGWVGTDMNRLWLKSEGFAGDGTVSDGDQEALYDRPIPHMRYFDAQAGVRADLDSGPTRVWAAVGVEGLAPYFFTFEPAFYVRDCGHIAGRISSSWDLFITQGWVVQPQAELNFYSKDDPARQIGSGFSDIDTGVRLRYVLTRNSIHILDGLMTENMAVRPVTRTSQEKRPAIPASSSGSASGTNRSSSVTEKEILRELRCGL
jgi:copper resistance protein B